MSKVLLATDHPTNIFPFARVLRALGIDFAWAQVHGPGFDTPAGRFAWTDTTGIRNHLRAYDAVIVYDGLERLTGGDRACHRTLAWLLWNDPADPPIAYLRVGIHSSLAGANLPSDFPIIRPNPSDLANTAFRIQTNTASSSYDRHAGLRVRLEREGVELYTPCAMMPESDFNSGPFWVYLLDNAKHAALGANGKVLARPVSEDLTFPENAICGYQYRKHFLLPMLVRGTLANNWYTSQGVGYFWLLYALKLLGVSPASSIPAFLCMDDALTVHNFAGQLGQPTQAQFARIGLETYRHLAETLYPRSGIAMVCGLLTGGRYGRRSEPLTSTMHEHWKLVQDGQYWNGSAYVNLEPEAHANLVAWHNLLVQHHRGGLPCTIHDHTIRHRQNRVWTTFTRHSDSGYAYAAPKDVPEARGTLVRKANWVGSPPSGSIERVIDGEVYYEYGMPTTGSGATVSDLDMRSVHGCRVAWESAVAEMRALGFPDAIGNGNYPLIISPNFLTGGMAVWRVLREIGYRLVRCLLPVNNSTLAPEESDVQPVPFTGVFEGLHFVGSLDWDCGAATGGTYGLWHATQGSFTAVGVQNLDLSSDISGIWSSDRPTASRRAYRRYVGLATERFLRGFSTLTALPVCHPPAMLSWADPNDPTRPFDPNDTRAGGPSINFLLEVVWNIEKVVQVLSPYLKWGTVLEYVAARERVMGA